MFLPLQMSLLMHGRTISLPCSLEGWGPVPAWLYPSFSTRAIVPYTRSPLQCAPSPHRADAGSRDGSCWIQPYLGMGLPPPLGSAATVLGQQGIMGPKQGTPAPSWALQRDALEHPPQRSKSHQMSLKQGHILEGLGPLLLPPHTDVLLCAGPAEPMQRRGSWG